MTSLPCKLILFLLLSKSFKILQPRNMAEKQQNTSVPLILLPAIPSLDSSSLPKRQTMWLWSPPPLLIKVPAGVKSGLCPQHFTEIAWSQSGTIFMALHQASAVLSPSLIFQQHLAQVCLPEWSLSLLMLHPGSLPPLLWLCLGLSMADSFLLTQSIKIL